MLSCNVCLSMSATKAGISTQPSLPNLPQDSRFIVSSVEDAQIAILPRTRLKARSLCRMLFGVFAFCIAIVTMCISAKHFFAGDDEGYALVAFWFLSGAAALCGFTAIENALTCLRTTRLEIAGGYLTVTCETSSKAKIRRFALVNIFETYSAVSSAYGTGHVYIRVPDSDNKIVNDFLRNKDCRRMDLFSSTASVVSGCPAGDVIPIEDWLRSHIKNAKRKLD